MWCGGAATRRLAFYGVLASCTADESTATHLDESESDAGVVDPGPLWEPDAPPSIETAHLRIWEFGPEELCAGWLAHLESEVVRLSTEMQIPLPVEDKLMVLWGSTAAADFCSDRGFPVNGCSGGLGTEAYVATTGVSASHELVHGLRRRTGKRTHAFFEEGLAEHLGSGRPNRIYTP